MKFNQVDAFQPSQFRRIGLRKLLIGFVCVCLFLTWTLLIDHQKSMKKHFRVNNPDEISKANFIHQRSILTDTKVVVPTPKPLVKIKDDPTKLMDVGDFSYSIRQPACDDSVQALIVVFSAPKNLNKRDTIRNTWGNAELLSGTPIRILYFFGAIEDPKVQEELNKENAKYKDIVQGSFVDHYRNLTYKHVMALKWYAEFCDTAQILIKADDDVYVNTPQLLQYSRNDIEPKRPKKSTKAVFFKQPRDLLFGKTFSHSKVSRQAKTKWYVTKEEFPDDYYPLYCYGQAIIYSTDVVYSLLEQAQKEKYFWVDDVFITGIIRTKLNITAIDSREYVLEKKEYDGLDKSGTSLIEREFLFSWHSLPMKYMKEIWELYMSQLARKISFNYLKSKSKE